MVYVPGGGLFRTGSLWLRSNTRFHIARGAAIYGSDNPDDYPIDEMMPSGYQTHKTSEYRALFSGHHIENVSITGENDGYSKGSLARFSVPPIAPNGGYNNNTDDTTVSVIDGVGWKWWCWYKSFPIRQSYCDQMNPTNRTMPGSRMRPKLIEFKNATNVVLDRFTARNSPVWFIHPFLSKNITMTNLTLLAPRSIGNTDGLDPDSCENVLADSCYLDVGDDGVSIKVRCACVCVFVEDSLK
jgi:polygalacturonase